jgi:hypothetical protein
MRNGFKSFFDRIDVFGSIGSTSGAIDPLEKYAGIRGRSDELRMTNYE